jgi:type II secretory pathway pseudopilin PulG
MIEMLVVSAILGILTAVASMSMVGVAQAATHRAQDQELMTVQSAMSFMVMDQLAEPGDACSLFADGQGGTSDMSRFPSTLPVTGSSARGEPTDRRPVQLYPHYLRTGRLSRAYVCTGGGTVRPAA